MVGFGMAGWVLPRLQKYRDLKLSREDWWYILAWGMFGAVIGGRLGYVFFYESQYFLAHPGEILAIWNGGMASHGGFIGVGVTLWFSARKLKIDFLKLFDVIVVPAALALALGRVGNFLNGELFFPPALAWLAVGKDLLVSGISYLVLKKYSQPGAVLAAFLISYGLLRFLVEYLRVQEFAGAWGLTRGQMFTLPVILIGIILWFKYSTKSNKKP